MKESQGQKMSGTRAYNVFFTGGKKKLGKGCAGKKSGAFPNRSRVKRMGEDTVPGLRQSRHRRGDE